MDDNATARGILCEYLRSWGCLVEEAASGTEALAALRLRAGRPDAIRLALVDLRMQGMDGWQLASEISSDKSINATRLVLLSPAGLSAEEAKMKLLRWFNAYLGKPVRKALLLETVFSVSSDNLDLEEVPADEPADDALPSGAAARVLVADDNETSRELFRVVLEKSGYSVETVEDGRQAVQRFASGGFDIAFLDVNMPVMGGPEAAQAMRRAGVRSPIIAVTASVRREEQERCLAAGMSAFLAKPFRRRDLAKVLREWLPAGSLPGVEPPPSPAGQKASLARPPAVPTSRPDILDFPAAVDAFMGREEVVRGLIRGFLERLVGRIAPCAAPSRGATWRRSGSRRTP